MLKDMIDKYAWVNDIEAWTVAVITGPPADEVVHIYGGDPVTPVGNYFFAEARELQGGGYPDQLRFHLQILSHGDHVVVLENNGWSGSIPEIARRCSADGGHSFSVYWNVNAFGMLVEAVDGKVTAHFESLYPIAPEPPQPGEVRPAWSIGPETEPGAAWPTCLALMEQQTGLAFDQQWLTTQLPTYRIPDPGELLKDVENARSAATDAVLRVERHPGTLPDFDDLPGGGERARATDKKRGGSDPVPDGPHPDGPPEPGRRPFGI